MRFHLYRVYRIVKFIETESRMVVARGCGGGRNGEVLFKGYSVSVWKDKINSGDGWW